MALRLHTIIASTRPGRVGPAVATWFHEAAREHGAFDAHLVDLADFELPVYDEPHHPRMRKYTHEHTRRWSASVEAADAYVFVTPEYNYGPTPALVNALNYVYGEWNYKPCGFVSYGGVSGGLRAVQMTKQIVTTLKMMPMVEAVMVPMVAQQLKEGVFAANDLQRQSVGELLGELHKWAGALAPLRVG
ncbi:NAD(P)H-dependent oxidoreductase [Aquabacter sp. CN5-332]|uniref:NADPH-dependent FMN reductase n=1 Tax=Aquabacter sp. CN5-332 TaxID=3156608 RepID=UPI0032B5793C